MSELEDATESDKLDAIIYLLMRLYDIHMMQLRIQNHQVAIALEEAHRRGDIKMPEFPSGE